MKAFFKQRTQQPICLYLSAAETAQLLQELAGRDLEHVPVLQRVQQHLTRVFATLTKERPWLAPDDS